MPTTTVVKEPPRPSPRSIALVAACAVAVAGLLWSTSWGDDSSAGGDRALHGSLQAPGVVQIEPAGTGLTDCGAAAKPASVDVVVDIINSLSNERLQPFLDSLGPCMKTELEVRADAFRIGVAY
jgi:hypothetical protein